MTSTRVVTFRYVVTILVVHIYGTWVNMTILDGISSITSWCSNFHNFNMTILDGVSSITSWHLLSHSYTHARVQVVVIERLDRERVSFWSKIAWEQHRKHSRPDQGQFAWLRAIYQRHSRMIEPISNFNCTYFFFIYIIAFFFAKKIKMPPRSGFPFQTYRHFENYTCIFAHKHQASSMELLYEKDVWNISLLQTKFLLPRV